MPELIDHAQTKIEFDQPIEERESEENMQNIKTSYPLYNEVEHNFKERNSLDDYPMILRVEDVQEILGIGRSSSYTLVKSGTLRSVRIGRAIRIPKSELKRFLGEQGSVPN